MNDLIFVKQQHTQIRSRHIDQNKEPRHTLMHLLVSILAHFTNKKMIYNLKHYNLNEKRKRSTVPCFHSRMYSDGQGTVRTLCCGWKATRWDNANPMDRRKISHMGRDSRWHTRKSHLNVSPRRKEAHQKMQLPQRKQNTPTSRTLRSTYWRQWLLKLLAQSAPPAPLC